MQSSICLEDVDEGAPKCRTVSTERDGQPPASEPPPVTANFEPPDGPAYRGSRHKRGRYVEGAEQKKNGKWINSFIFPGREFDDLDAYRAAKKQRVARRSAYSDQARDNRSWGR